MKRQWDIQTAWNPWLSIGVHFDHTDPSITLHMPLMILAVGRLKQPGFRPIFPLSTRSARVRLNPQDGARL